jgi:hypothetical protein
VTSARLSIAAGEGSEQAGMEASAASLSLAHALPPLGEIDQWLGSDEDLDDEAMFGSDSEYALSCLIGGAEYHALDQPLLCGSFSAMVFPECYIHDIQFIASAQ